MKKPHNIQIASKLLVTTPLTTKALLMRKFIANFIRILGICKDFAGNRINELGNIPRCGVVPKFSDLEVVALGITAEAFGFDSENLLFHRLHSECKNDLPNLISRHQFNARRKLTARLAEEIRKDVAVAIDGAEDVFCVDSKPVKVCQNARAKRGVMGWDNPDAAPDDNLMIIRNYAKQSCGLFTRMAGKIAAMTFMQYVNFSNHRTIR
ncbi:hypothetical protein IX330_001899 [Bacteroides pyogenes]|uniref:hypothetical protein n=1 Tax=Bacteroides pyogenes TaxID=310300 RepID=UPI001BA5C280|nr:hypothetical protein [Bacteroides pyogenes]MBR8720749.1 hypothetical protein [Bacteroides pyogenes]MBR8793091.1 hypothetical protein [Bacteroides pyogenes]